ELIRQSLAGISIAIVHRRRLPSIAASMHGLPVCCIVAPLVLHPRSMGGVLPVHAGAIGPGHHRGSGRGEGEILLARFEREARTFLRESVSLNAVIPDS